MRTSTCAVALAFIHNFGKSKCRSDNLEEVEGRADKMQSNARNQLSRDASTVIPPSSVITCRSNGCI